jgi:hypothetical protein
MRDFRDAKAMAKTVRDGFAAKGLRITVAESLELIASAFGVADWNRLAAAIRAAETEAPRPERPQESAGPNDAARTNPARRSMDWVAEDFDHSDHASAALTVTLWRASDYAEARQHQHMTTEHLLLALTEDADAKAVLEACDVDVGALKLALASFIDEELAEALRTDDVDAPSPTAAVRRVVKRAATNVRPAGRATLTGANVLVALLSEPNSHAAHLLRERGMTHMDAVKVLVPSRSKDGGRAA